MTTPENKNPEEQPCPVQSLLKILSGKWRSTIFRMALRAPLRFNTLLREIEGSNRQSLSTALKGLEDEGLLEKITISEKPLHIEYHLTSKGHSLVEIFQQLEQFSKAD